jgi:hypothetical protein
LKTSDTVTLETAEPMVCVLTNSSPTGFAVPVESNTQPEPFHTNVVFVSVW